MPALPPCGSVGSTTKAEPRLKRQQIQNKCGKSGGYGILPGFLWQGREAGAPGPRSGGRHSRSPVQETHGREGLDAEAMSVSYSLLQLLFMHLTVNAKGEVT